MAVRLSKPSGPVLPSARGIDHVGLTVPDIEQAKEFFTGLLGFVKFYDHGPYSDETGDSDVRRFDRHPRTVCQQICLIRTHNLNIELFQFSAPDQQRRMPRGSDWGACHIAIYVDDMEAALRFLRQADGVRVLEGPLPLPGPESGAKAEFCYFITPWGQDMEVISYPYGKAYEAECIERLYNPTEPETVWT